MKENLDSIALREANVMIRDQSKCTHAILRERRNANARDRTKANTPPYQTDQNYTRDRKKANATDKTKAIPDKAKLNTLFYQIDTLSAATTHLCEPQHSRLSQRLNLHHRNGNFRQLLRASPGFPIVMIYFDLRQVS